jgi:hypothetical protein
MKSDSYFEIGSTHQVCQDYAISYADDDIAYAILSDGCTSSPNTDIGARILSIVAKDAINYLYQREKFNNEFNEKLFLNKFVITLKELIIKKCLEVKGSLNLNINSFDATLLIAIAFKKYSPLIFGWGDGNFIVKYKDGTHKLYSLSYDGNMPYYLSYQMSYDKDQAYRQEQKGMVWVNEIVVNSATKEVSLDDKNAYDPYLFNFNKYLSFPEGVSQIIVTSDGLQSFQYDPKSEEYLQRDSVFSIIDAYPKMVDYKNVVGEFVVRRMRSLEKENRSKHIIHTDDVSCATIVLD